MSFFDDDGVSNPSANQEFGELLDALITRRRILNGGLGAAALAFVAGPSELLGDVIQSSALMGFTKLPVSLEDRVLVRFLTGPRGCEITGVTETPDGRTLFVNVQHPGEPSSERNDPRNPGAVSTWPDGPGIGRPRSATIVIRKDDGGVVGT